MYPHIFAELKFKRFVRGSIFSFLKSECDCSVFGMSNISLINGFCIETKILILQK